MRGPRRSAPRLAVALALLLAPGALAQPAPGLAELGGADPAPRCDDASGACSLRSCAEAFARAGAPTPPAGACQTAEALRPELQRLLRSVAHHCTVSRVCHDGPGVEVQSELVKICEQQRSDSALELWVGYCLRESRPRRRQAPPPVWTAHATTLRFRPVPGGWQLDLPQKLPGMEPARCSPLDTRHDTLCNGVAAPFASKVVSLR